MHNNFATFPLTIANPAHPRINRHYRTGETLPEDVVESFCATKQVFSAVDVHTQLFYSMLDQGRYSVLL